MIVWSPVLYSSFWMFLFSQFSPHPVLVSLWGIEQWAGCGPFCPANDPWTADFKAPFIKFGRKLSNLPLPVRRLSSQTPLRGRRKDILWTDQWPDLGPAGSHNKRFLLWHFVNTGKWRKLFGNIICWWFENVEEKYIFKFGSQFQESSPPPHFTLQFWDKFLASMKLKRILWSIWFSKYHLGSKFNFSVFNIFCLNVCNLPGCQKISCIIFFWH